MHLSGILLNCKGLNKIHSYHICSPSTLCTPPGTNFGITALFQCNVQLQHINYLFLKKSLAEVLCSSPLCCTKKVNWSKTLMIKTTHFTGCAQISFQNVFFQALFFVVIHVKELRNTTVPLFTIRLYLLLFFLIHFLNLSKVKNSQYSIYSKFQLK